MDLRLGPGQPADRVQRQLLDRFGGARILDHASKRRHGPIHPVGDVDQHPGAAHVPAGLVPDVDPDLVTQTQCFHGGVEHGAVGTTVDERAQRHVAGDAGETVEIRERHARVLLICTAAASMGCMLGGRLTTRTETAAT